MRQYDSDYQDLLQFMEHLAQISGQIIRHYYRTGYTVESKADASPVTIADREAERIMREAIMARFPEHGIMGEEYGAYQPGAEYQWVLDPIDGTKNFVAHSYLFGTLIALVHNGHPLLGAIHQPVVEDLLIGDGQHTWLNGTISHVRGCESIEEAVLVGTEHWTVHQYQNGPAFDAFSRRTRQYRGWGDCHGYYLLATGGADIMVDPILEVWDLMALAPIVTGAGGMITDWQGKGVVGGSGAVATAGPIHAEVIQALNP